MKKVVVIFAVVLVAFTGKLSAQTVIMEDVLISSIKIKEGANTFPTSNNKGTVKFVKRGDIFTDVFYVDATGKSIKLEPTRGGANGAPKPQCKTTLPDVCFGNVSKNIGICICKPDNLSNGTETYNIGLLLPAVQKVREAAQH